MNILTGQGVYNESMSVYDGAAHTRTVDRYMAALLLWLWSPGSQDSQRDILLENCHH